MIFNQQGAASTWLVCNEKEHSSIDPARDLYQQTNGGELSGWMSKPGSAMQEVATLYRKAHVPIPCYSCKGRKRSRPAVISLIPFLSGRRTDAGDGGGSANRRADVYRLDIYLSRSRLFFPLMVDGGVRVCREGAPPRFAFPGGVGEAKATTTLGNNVSKLLSRPGGVPLRRQRWSRGVLFWRPGPALHRFVQVMWVLVSSFFKGTEQAAGMGG